ncbi:MAG: hypothetical protein LUQ07_02885 [Methanospirillum sp.]|nr:hypothetical protein [Methanospirillum sp.]
MIEPLELPVFSLIGIPVILVVAGFFLLMLKILTRSGRFFVIRKRWPAEMKPAGTEYNRQNIALQGVWFKNTANLVVAGKGLYLSFGFPVSLYEPGAAFIPWNSVRFIKKGRAFLTDVYEYEVWVDPPVILTVTGLIAGSFPGDLNPGIVAA